MPICYTWSITSFPHSVCNSATPGDFGVVVGLPLVQQDGAIIRQTIAERPISLWRSYGGKAVTPQTPAEAQG